MCLDVANNSHEIKLIKCHKQKGNQEWEYSANGRIRHMNSNYCLGELEGGNLGNIRVSEMKKLWVF